MEVMYILIGFSLMVALIFLGLFFWAVKDGQYDDSYTPSIRILFDNETSDSKNNSKSTDNNNR